MRCKSFKDDPNISPVDHSPDQPNTLHLSKKSTTFGDNILPKQNNMTRILYKIQEVLVYRTTLKT